MPLTARGASLHESPRDLKLSKVNTTHQFCPGLSSNPAPLSLCHVSANSMVTHPTLNLNEYLTHPSPPLRSHDHYFSSDSIHFSPGLLPEIPLSRLISFTSVLHRVIVVLFIQDEACCEVGFCSCPAFCLESHY